MSLDRTAILVRWHQMFADRRDRFDREQLAMRHRLIRLGHLKPDFSLIAEAVKKALGT